MHINSNLFLSFVSGIRLGTDDMLRASYYTPSPARRTSSFGGTPTPRRTSSSRPTPTSTPTAAAVKKRAAAAVRTPTVKSAAASCVAESGARERQQQMEQLNTDNLLNLSAMKRPRAQDFFMKPAD